MFDLSVLIPARNEMFLQRTVEDVLENSSDKTEIIVVLDGYWPDEGLSTHPRVSVIHRDVSIGQRAATNEAARTSRAKYIMKLDAHCAMDKGFDQKLIEAAVELGSDVTQVPAQYNLHAYDWKCDACETRTYQGPTPKNCKKCGHEAHGREMVWARRKSRLTTAWRFDHDLKFQYWGAFKKTPEGKKEISETLSLLGACWFMSRERFWELDGLDEGHGSWGQMGTEIACKSWLSGGKVVCNKQTWYAHMFRTQGGDFGFPYPISGNQVNRARKYSKELWIDGKWPKQKHKLEWLIERFAPVPDWETPTKQEADDFVDLNTNIPVPSSPDAKWDYVAQRDSSPSIEPVIPTKGVVWYTDNRLDATIAEACQHQLLRAVNGRPCDLNRSWDSYLEIVTVSLAPVDSFGRNVVLPLERGYLTMFKQILIGLEMSSADVIFFAEHDVLYHPSHFDFTPECDNIVYYNTNVWKVNADDGQALYYITKQTSGLCAYRKLLIEHYRKRVAMVEEHGFSRKMGFEPGSHSRSARVDDLKSEAWTSEFPNVDIRHNSNLTPSRWRQDQFRNQRNCRGWKEADEVPGWGKTKGRFDDFLVKAGGKA